MAQIHLIDRMWYEWDTHENINDTSKKHTSKGDVNEFQLNRTKTEKELIKLIV